MSAGPGGGAAGERTDLAWTRTALGFLVNAALVGRLAGQHAVSPIGYAVAGLMGAEAVALWWYGHRHASSRAAALREGRVTARPGAVRALWLATVATTAAALAVALLALVP